jgi:cation diffusion facilitator CzcD-associated flavoprotein CzcO
MSETTNDHEVIVIGAGISGIYQIKCLTDLGMDAMLLEGDDDLGGTWYRNRYPGCRFDSESYTYGYSFSRELLDEWHWKERFSAQPENLRYLNYVADKFDLRRHMRFNTFVDGMEWDDAAHRWTLHLRDGGTYRARFVVASLGTVCVPTLPNVEGRDSFEGESFHTYFWPKEPVTLEGKRVGIIGTGATGIQVIQTIAEQVDELTVFQRRPNWSAPLNNSPISDEEMAEIRRRYDEIFANCAASASGLEHLPDRRGFWNVTKEERIAFWDELYDKPGFAILAGNFAEIYTDEAANRELSEYIADRMRQRVHDPVVAEKLIPRDHGFGMQRLPLETNYLEAYNRDNVHLVDLTAAPIERVTPTGIRTTDDHYELDVIIYATGFDAITGPYDRVRITGVGGEQLKDKWHDGPITYFGVMTHGFPNLFMAPGPQAASGGSNFPRAIEVNVDGVTDLVRHAMENGYTRVEAQEDAEQWWFQEVKRALERLLLSKMRKGWIVGENSNIEGRDGSKILYPAYWGGGSRFAKLFTEARTDDFRGFEMRTSTSSPAGATT